jgi:hypothetical protein
MPFKQGFKAPGGIIKYGVRASNDLASWASVGEASVEKNIVSVVADPVAKLESELPVASGDEAHSLENAGATLGFAAEPELPPLEVDVFEEGNVNIDAVTIVPTPSMEGSGLNAGEDSVVSVGAAVEPELPLEEVDVFEEGHANIDAVTIVPTPSMEGSGLNAGEDSVVSVGAAVEPELPPLEVDVFEEGRANVDALTGVLAPNIKGTGLTPLEDSADVAADLAEIAAPTHTEVENAASQLLVHKIDGSTPPDREVLPLVAGAGVAAPAPGEQPSALSDQLRFEVASSETVLVADVGMNLRDGQVVISQGEEVQQQQDPWQEQEAEERRQLELALAEEEAVHIATQKEESEPPALPPFDVPVPESLTFFSVSAEAEPAQVAAVTSLAPFEEVNPGMLSHTILQSV